MSGTTSASGNFLINSGATLSASSYALSVGGNWTNSGTFTASTSTVTLTGSSKTLTGTSTFNALNISGSYTSSSNITISGATTLSGSLNSGSTTVTFSGNLTGNGALTNSGTITFSGTSAQSLQINSALTTTGTVNFNGSVQPTISSSSVPTFYNLNLNNTGGITPASDWRVNNTTVIAASVTFAGGANTHSFYGAFTNNGTITSSDTFNFTPTSAVTVALMGSGFTSTGCVNFGGAGAITITGTPTSVENVLISNTNAAGISFPTSWTINGNLSTLIGTTLSLGTAFSHTLNGTLNCAGTLDGGTSTLTMNGTTEFIQGTGDISLYNFTVAAASTITASTDYQIKKDFTNNGTYDATGFLTEFVGTLTSTISGTTTPTTIDILTVTKTSATVTVAVNISTLTQITVNSGTLDVSNKTITQDVTLGDLDIESGATLKVGGNNNIPTFNTYTINANGTVEFNGNNQSINSSPVYGNVIVSAAGLKTPSGSLTLNGNFLMSAGTFVGGNYTHSIGGNWTMSGGTFTSTNTTISFNGTGTQTLSSTGSFNNLTMNKASGSFTLLTDVTVNGTLTFTTGNITTSSYKVIMPSGSAVSRTSGHVVGNLQKYFSSTAAKTFEIGDASIGYTPVTITFTSVTSNGNLIATTTTGDHIDITNSSVDATKSVNRYYTLTNSGIGFTNYTAVFNFLAGDLDAGATTSNFIVANRPSSAWTFPTVGTKTGTSTQCTGNTTFGDFQVGEYGQKLWDGGASTTNWGDANNWNPNGVPTSSENIVLNAAVTVDINVAAVCRDLTISHSGVTLTILATRSLTASGNFSISTGILNTAASYPSITGTTSLTGGTIGYTLGGAQTVAAVNYYNLTLATSGTKTFASGTVGIANSFSITGTASVNASTNSSTFNLIGTAPQTLTSGSTTFYNLAMSNSSGVTLADNCTVSNVLSLSSGIIATGSNRIICTSTSAGAVANQSSSSYINGNLRRYIANNTSTYAFPVGTASAYTLEEMINNNLAGITYIDASFGAKPGNDNGIIAWENGTYYTSVNSFGVWYLTPNANPSSGTYDLKCYTNAFSGLTNNSFGILSRPDASSNAAQWGKAGGTLNSTNGLGRLVSDGYALRKGLTSFSQKGIGQAGQGLPIELSAFDVKKENQNVVLNWTTASEMNNDHFDIESAIASGNNLEFKKIGEVSGMGTSLTVTQYQYIDQQNNFSGTVYYRLKQVDANSQFTYSEIKSVVFENAPISVSDLYPNPVADNFSFEIQTVTASQIKIQVINSVGQIVIEKSIIVHEGSNPVNMNIERLPEGLYFIEVTDQNNLLIQNRKIIKS